MCALYLRLLLERGVPVQNLLVVTFTKAATAELRDRIRVRIVETLAHVRAGVAGEASSDPFVRALVESLEGRGIDRALIGRRLDEALQFFDEAAIFTIHGFCQRALADARSAPACRSPSTSPPTRARSRRRR